ncbi:hypothetical protein ACHAXT_006029 [Thalassiosira profunda]
MSTTGDGTHIVLTRRQAWRYSLGLLLIYHVAHQLASQLRGQLASIRVHLSTDLGGHMLRSSVHTHNLNLRALEQHMHDRRRALLNASSVMMLGQCSGCPEPSEFFHGHFDGEMEFVKPWREMEGAEASVKGAYLDLFANPNQSDLLVGGACDTYRAFAEAGGIRRKHVLVAGINENWGEFSTPVPNRTVDWGEWRGHFESNGCREEDLWAYLDNENVSAVFTTTHQFIDHPKAISVPLGVHDPDILIELLRRGDAPNRTELLVINQSLQPHRVEIANSVIANFNRTGTIVENAYVPEGDKYPAACKICARSERNGVGHLPRLGGARLGDDPVLERYYRKDGFYRTFDDLPVLWVDHFDNVTPALLEAEYPRILSRARSYKLEKLTNWWWVNLINSYREHPGRPSIPKEPKRDVAEKDESQSASLPEAATATSLDETPGISHWRTQGNASACREVMFYVDSRLPRGKDTFVRSSWTIASHVVRTSAAFNETCLAFFHVSEKRLDGMRLHRGTRAMLQIALEAAQPLLQHDDGLVCEFGVASGRSIRMTNEMLPLETPIHGFDTFTGLPHAWGSELDVTATSRLRILL